MSELSHYPCLLAIETDATSFHGAGARLPKLPDKTAAEQLIAHIAADLEGLLPGIRGTTLSTCAAVYDQTQVLRPGYPLFDALQQLLEASYQGQSFQPRLTSFAAADGRMPHIGLQPAADIPLSMLVLIPALVSGEPDAISSLAYVMESRFMEHGQVSAGHAQWLAATFDIEILHARYMTVTDLAAMLRMQLDSVGFLHLWELLDHALNLPLEPCEIETPSGSYFKYSDAVVTSRLLTFDQWAAGPGAGIEADQRALSEGFCIYTQQQRQYLVSLAAHGIPIVHQSADGSNIDPDQLYFCDIQPAPDITDPATLTYHSNLDLGTIAMTVIHGDTQYDYYPLLPSGLAAIEQRIAEQLGDNPVIAYSATICMDAVRRRLLPESMASD